MFRRSKPASPALQSLPDPALARKPNRLGLYAPFALLLVAVVGWTIFWFQVRHETGQRLDAAAQALRAAGYEVAWNNRVLGGYPFRMDVTLDQVRVRDPSGWSIATPRLEAEAFMHGLGHWVIAAPQGLTFTRPRGGPVAVTGKLVRASLNSLDKTPPSFSFQGQNLVFTPGPGAQPFDLASADSVELHLRPGPDDQGAVMLKVDGGKAPAASLFGRIAGDKPVAIVWDSILTKVSAFRGKAWPQAARAWSDGGGQIQLRQAGLTAGDALVGAAPAVLTVGSDGRLRGSLDLNLKQAQRILAAMAQGGIISADAAQTAATVAAARQGTGDEARVALTFQAGQTTLGPAAIAPAPQVY